MIQINGVSKASASIRGRACLELTPHFPEILAVEGGERKNNEHFDCAFADR
jgi:hypothetical protein